MPPKSFYIGPVAGCTCSLEVERHHMTANGPQWEWVIVGGLHALTFGIGPAQRFAVVQQEFFGAALSRHLVFHKGADLFVAVAVFKHTESGRKLA